MPPISHAALLGADHPELGSVAVTAVDAEAVVALSAGKYPKPYPHLDPNEDAILAAVGGGCRLLAVADGHNGFDAAGGAIRGVRGALDLLELAAADPWRVLEELEAAAVEGLRTALSDVAPVRRGSRTALTIALALPDAVHLLQWGDTAGLRVRRGKGKLLVPSAPFLSAYGEVPDRASQRLRTNDLLVVASDGLSTYLGDGWERRVGQLVGASADLETAARSLVEAACAGGAGDHVAVGVMVAGRGTPGGS